MQAHHITENFSVYVNNLLKCNCSQWEVKGISDLYIDYDNEKIKAVKDIQKEKKTSQGRN